MMVHSSTDNSQCQGAFVHVEGHSIAVVARCSLCLTVCCPKCLLYNSLSTKHYQHHRLISHQPRHPSTIAANFPDTFKPTSSPS